MVRRLRTPGLLRRLHDAGLLTSYVEPSEEGLNERGRTHLVDSAKAWQQFSATMPPWWTRSCKPSARRRGDLHALAKQAEQRVPVGSYGLEVGGLQCSV